MSRGAKSLSQMSLGIFVILVLSAPQEKRVDKATLEMEPEYPGRYFDDLATDLCTSKSTRNLASLDLTSVRTRQRVSCTGRHGDE